MNAIRRLTHRFSSSLPFLPLPGAGQFPTSPRLTSRLPGLIVRV